MAQTITATIEQSILEYLLPNFDIKGGDIGWLRTQVKQQVELAIAKGLMPALTPGDPTVKTIRVNFSVAEPYATKMLVAIAAIDGLKGPTGNGAYCRGLLHALAALPREISQGTNWKKDAGQLGLFVKALNANRAEPYKERPEQALFYIQLMDAFGKGKVALAEASTGVGKSLAILSAGIETIRIRNTRLLISVPTLALAGQYADTHQELAAADPSIPPMRVIFGRPEFVSCEQLAEFLKSPAKDVENVDEARAWVAGGGLAPEGVSIQIPWLVASLQAVAPEFPVSEIKLSALAAEDDPANIAYHDQFQANRDRLPEIMVCSHAMAAIDRQRRMWLGRQDDDYRTLSELRFQILKDCSGQAIEVRRDAVADAGAISAELGLMLADLTDKNGMLPSYQVLVVDEAHQFEANASRALSNEISMKEVLKNLWAFRQAGGRMGKERIEEAANAVQVLIAWGKISDERVLLKSEDSSLQAIKSALRTIYNVASSAKKGSALEGAGLRPLALLKRAAEGLKLALDGKVYAYLQYSPVRAYPQLLVGRKSVENVLSLMWNSLDCGAAVSATLYLEQSGGGASGDHQTRLLAIPKDKLSTYTPVAPSWLIRPVKEVWTVHQQQGTWLKPPKTTKGQTEAEFAEAEKRWISEVGAVLVDQIIPTAAGGILVLMTSHPTRAHLETILFDAGLSDRIVSASPGISLRKQIEVYLRKAHAVHTIPGTPHPIWLAVGGAWTGLDIGGHGPYAKLFGTSIPAALDNVLTDLVIPRIPFRMNRSITHDYRMVHSPSFTWELFDTAFLHKQGTGRLVRTEGLPQNRRIWNLDARLAIPPGCAPVRATLRQYPHQFALVKPNS